MEIKKIDLDKEENVPTKFSENIQEKKLVIDKDPIFPQDQSKTKKTISIVAMIVVIAAAGFYSGAFIKSKTSKGASISSALSGIQSEVPSEGVKVGDIYGSPDEKAFSDPSTGVIDKGGLDGEGSHKLVREGGVSQTVYLTSSVIDLDMLVGHKVTIWGQTFNGQKVGWLMDVGRAKVEELNVPLPK